MSKYDIRPQCECRNRILNAKIRYSASVRMSKNEKRRAKNEKRKAKAENEKRKTQNKPTSASLFIPGINRFKFMQYHPHPVHDLRT